MDKIYQKIKLSGHRLTKTRQALIEILFLNGCLLNKKDIISRLHNKKIKPDRSTLYRELLFLVGRGIIQKTAIGKTDYYEIQAVHHHHLVCLKCHSIKDIDIGNCLDKKEKIIARKNKFNILNHALEFYGYCRKCQALFNKK